MVYHRTLNIVLSIELKSLLWACIGLKLGHLLWEGGGELSSLTVSSPSVPLSFLSLTSSLSSKVEARGEREVSLDYSLAVWLGAHDWGGCWLGEPSMLASLDVVPWFRDVLSPGLWPLLLGPWSDRTLIPQAVCPLGGTPLWPPKPVAAFCAHTDYMLVLIAPCSLL